MLSHAIILALFNWLFHFICNDVLNLALSSCIFDRQKCIKRRVISGLLSEDQWRNQATLACHWLVNVTTRIQRNPPASHSWQSEAVHFYHHSEQPSCASVPASKRAGSLPAERGTVCCSKYWVRFPDSRFTVAILSTEDHSARCRLSQHFSRPHLWVQDRTLPLQGSGFWFAFLIKTCNRSSFLSHCTQKKVVDVSCC